MRNGTLTAIFVTGVLAATVALGRMFKPAEVAAWLGLLALVMGGLNLLLRTGARGKEPYVTSTAAGLIRRRPVMVTASCVVWLVAVITFAVDGWRWFRLRDAGPPLDVRYARLAGRSIDLLIDPPRDLRLPATIDGERIVFTDTAAWRTLAGLRQRFSVENGHTELQFGSRGNGESLTFEVEPYRTMRMFAGACGDGQDNQLDPHVRPAATAADVQSLSDPAAGWVALYSGASIEGAPGSELLFRRPLRLEDLPSDSALASFWREVIGDELPEGFGWVDLAGVSFCLHDPVLVKTIVAPLMSLEVAIFTNDEAKPVRLGTAVFREIESRELRPLPDDDRSLATAQRRVAELHDRLLRPQQTVVIPLRLILSYPNPEEFEAAAEHVDAGLRDAAAYVRSSTALKFGEFTINGSDLALSSNRFFDSSRVWVDGPSARLEKLVVDGKARRARPVPAELPFVSSGNPIGSCPWIASFDGHRWRPAGVILRGRDRVDRRGTDERPLRAFTGRVRIEEREHEITTLDRVYVVAVDEHHRETRLLPRDARLRNDDGVSVQLVRGDVLDVVFDAPPPQARWFRLGATGYYSVLEQ